MTHFSEKRPYLGIAQNGGLREIPTDMFLREGHLLRLKVQCNLPKLLTIPLQPFFPKLSTMSRVALSNRMTGSLIDLVQRGWLIAEKLPYLFQ